VSSGTIDPISRARKVFIAGSSIAMDSVDWGHASLAAAMITMWLPSTCPP
jgi:hypothetical protein